MFNIGDMVCTNNKKLVGVIVDINPVNVILAVVWNDPPFAQGCKSYTTQVNKIQLLPKGTRITFTTKDGRVTLLKYNKYDNKRRALYGENGEVLLYMDTDKLVFDFKIDNDIETKNSKQYTSLDIEPWDIMKADFTRDEFIGFLKGNIIKYCLRKKGSDLQDFEKIEHYAKKLQEVLKHE